MTAHPTFFSKEEKRAFFKKLFTMCILCYNYPSAKNHEKTFCEIEDFDDQSNDSQENLTSSSKLENYLKRPT